MSDRLGGVYGADSKFPRRASQDNQQVRELYANYLGKPLGHKSEQLLHTKWFDKSAKMKELQAKASFRIHASKKSSRPAHILKE